MSKLTFVFVCIVAVTSSVYAFTGVDKAAFNEAIKPFIIECAKVHGLTENDLKAAKEAGTSVGLPPCFLACVLKKEELLNAQGLFVVEAVLPKLRQLIKNQEDLAHLEEVTKKCASINDQAVSDGEAGCDRAKLLFTCLRQNKGEISL